MSGSTSLAILVSHPIQYLSPLFQSLSNDEKIELTVYYESDDGTESYFDPGFEKEIAWDRPLLEEYEYEFIDTKQVSNRRSAAKKWFKSDLRKSISAGEHDAILLHGYNNITKVLSLIHAKSNGVTTLVRGDSTLKHGEGIKRSVGLPLILKFVDVCCAVGSENAKLYSEYGKDDKKIHQVPYSVDNEYFQAQKEKLPSPEILKSEFGINEDSSVILFVGKLIKIKNPDILLKAFAKVDGVKKKELVYVGDGAMMDELRNVSRMEGVENSVHFVGFKNQSELARYYKMADVFVLPSSKENWGLVINEAMNFSLPIVTTNAVGSATDLVDEKNGIVVEKNDQLALASSIETIINDDVYNRGEYSLKRINNWGIKQTKDSLISCIYKTNK